MRIIADLHIHSPYARAVSHEMTLPNLDHWARKKGITVLGTGDFTHPKWLRAIKSELEPAEPGLYVLKRQESGMRNQERTRFMLTVEVSSIYRRGGKVRRIHNLIFVPSVPSAEEIATRLGWLGNLASDGRPILGLDSEELAKIVFSIDTDAVLVPAHIWTPWFSVFGSMSGFDSLEECFGAYAEKIFAIETGLSSDPPMNWRLSSLDRVSLISNSDSHSLQRIGREANVLECEFSYHSIMDAIRSKDPARFLFTVEFYPEEGKYHYDGHAAHRVRMSPEETKRANRTCPVCRQQVTVGVLSRVGMLADRPEGFRPERAIPYRSTVPLDEIIGESLGLGVSSKKVTAEYERLLSEFGTEFAVLFDVSLDDIARVALPGVAEGIRRVRTGALVIEPGYDGEYGTVRIFSEEDRRAFADGQRPLFEL